MNILVTNSAVPRRSPLGGGEKYPPLGLGFLISVLRNARHTAFFTDTRFTPGNLMNVEDILGNRIDCVGIQANTVSFANTLRLKLALPYEPG